jgi:hypothetical protein
MLSDVLCDAVGDIDGYLESESPLYQAWYGGDIRHRIVAVRDQMDRLRQELDASGLNTPVPPFTSPEAADWEDIN